MMVKWIVFVFALLVFTFSLNECHGRRAGKILDDSVKVGVVVNKYWYAPQYECPERYTIIYRGKDCYGKTRDVEIPVRENQWDQYEVGKEYNR